MAPAPDVSTREIGTSGVQGLPLPTGPGGTYNTAGLYGVDTLEETPELRFPTSVYVYDRMRRTDGQVGSVLRAITLAIIGATRHLDTTDVRPEVARFVETELGLGDRVGLRRRRRQGVVWRQHLREACLMLPFGFVPFEQVYDIGPPSPGLEAPPGNNGLVAHLRKLALRPPRTLIDVVIGRDGGLAGIHQTPPMGDATMGTIGSAFGAGVPIPVDSLVFYCNDREGADWYGNSILRTAYPSWLIKDRLRRLGPMIAERNGMGLPIVTYPEDGSRSRALDLAKAARAGEEAGIALPEGYSFTLAGVSGDTRDELPLMKYHDEEIGRSALAMFLNLGHDNGARALGDTFLAHFLDSVDSVNCNLDDTATEHVIRDLVEHTFGPDEAYPVMVSEPLADDAPVVAEAVKALADAGIITPDHELEADVRRRLHLPAKPAGDPAVGPTPPAPGEPADGDPDATPPGPPTGGPAGDQGTYDSLTARLESATRTLAAMRAADRGRV